MRSASLAASHVDARSVQRYVSWMIFYHARLDYVILVCGLKRACRRNTCSRLGCPECLLDRKFHRSSTDLRKTMDVAVEALWAAHGVAVGGKAQYWRARAGLLVGDGEWWWRAGGGHTAWGGGWSPTSPGNSSQLQSNAANSSRTAVNCSQQLPTSINVSRLQS